MSILTTTSLLQSKMAPNVTVPTNFGIRLLDTPTHNTLELKASDGAIVMASSVILSLNSPVIDHMTPSLHLDVKEFSEPAVRSFVEAAYTGETPPITRDTFKDINEMSRVFKVDWLVTRCTEKFSQIAETILASSYAELLFLFEEAMFILCNHKSRQLLEIALKKIESLKWEQQFIARYLEDISTLSTLQIDSIIELAGSAVHFIIRPLTDQLTVNTYSRAVNCTVFEKITANCLNNYSNCFKMFLKIRLSNTGGYSSCIRNIQRRSSHQR